MILQRIANTFRQQHWGTLAIELLVVVAGIFIGLQVDDWNEGRKQRIQEENYLVLVARDVSEMQAELCGNRRMHNALVEMIDMQRDWSAAARRAADAIGSLVELLVSVNGAQLASE